MFPSNLNPSRGDGIPLCASSSVQQGLRVECFRQRAGTRDNGCSVILNFAGFLLQFYTVSILSAEWFQLLWREQAVVLSRDVGLLASCARPELRQKARAALRPKGKVVVLLDGDTIGFKRPGLLG